MLHAFPAPGARPRVSSRAAVLALLLGLTACGGSDGSGPDVPQESAPTITSQPADVTVDEGAAAAFSVTASGTAPLAYQWKRSGAAIAGATSASYTAPAVAAGDDGARFSVVVSNAMGSVESRAAVVRVRTAPKITAQPESRSTLGGEPTTFTVAATGADLTYQWRRDGRDIPGATGATYGVGVPLAADDGAVYSVVVANGLGSVTSAGATLSVDVGPAFRPTSYANAKGRNAPSRPTPQNGWYLALAYGDFFGTGAADFFGATLVYTQDEDPQQATRGDFEFWRWQGGDYVREHGVVSGDVGCVHPRKAAVADFNGDGRRDVFVACHGYDYAPNFPGEPSYVLLSRAGGGWESKAVTPTGFYHSVTAVDADGDGDTDVVVTDNFSDPSVFVFVNDGSGALTKRTDLLPFGRANYFTVEAADVDGDGRTDLLAGGHEWESAPTVVLLRGASGDFRSSTPRVLPAVANEGVVLDFVVLDADRNGVNEVYTLRTSGGDGTFYQSRTVQKVSWPALADTVIWNERPALWVPFIVPIWDGQRYSLVNETDNPYFRLALP